ncbi:MULTISPECIES: PhzF family phenazine biosynthesis protein [Spongiibacter]|uniref:PhzF family phenazine biosynthesis protein n=1 Tax=Spongiibacter TaxID=630749 RepID=UPI001B25ADA2|nr:MULTISPECIES: PhzF family phenazine biosynthesis protein [Spongiibacter]MBO6752190.1 PhzF family phenazine biosynthesis protein [Spongiibacter sp.]
MPHPIYIVDAFVCGPFTGNPAAVCLISGKESAQWMQRVAAEMNLSETAFIWHLQGNEWVLRWFTPRCEVDLCGHATLAAAHTLWQRGSDHDSIEFHTRSGVLTAKRDGQGIKLDFPADRPEPLSPEAAASVQQLVKDKAQWLGRGRDDALVVFTSAEEVRQFQPDFAQIQALPYRGLLITARGDEEGLDVVSRFFAPTLGIPEDPVTGAAHCLLAPYWCERLGCKTLRGLQASPRTGLVEMALSGQRVTLRGAANTVLVGEFLG